MKITKRYRSLYAPCLRAEYSFSCMYNVVAHGDLCLAVRCAVWPRRSLLSHFCFCSAIFRFVFFFVLFWRIYVSYGIYLFWYDFVVTTETGNTETNIKSIRMRTRHDHGVHD